MKQFQKPKIQALSAEVSGILNDSKPDLSHRHYLLNSGITPLVFYDTANNILCHAQALTELMTNSFTQNSVKSDPETYAESLGAIEDILDDLTAIAYFCESKLCFDLGLDPFDENIFAVLRSQAFKAKGCIAILAYSFGHDNDLPSDAVCGLLEAAADILNAASTALNEFSEAHRPPQLKRQA